MPSPFPGMNPYLEQSDTWVDFHTCFIAFARDAIGRQLGPNYLCKIEVRLILHELSADERRYFGVADVGVATTAEKSGSSVGVATLPAPIQLQLPAVESEHHRYLEIRDIRNRRVVTVLELLSPSNKTPGADHDDYIAKRRQVLAGQTHFVEIDLRRGGQRPSLPELPPCDYYALVSRYEERPRMDFWPIRLRECLPVIPVPLLAPDPDVQLDLRTVLDRAYDSAEYGRYIYSEVPEPLLSPDDETWAKQFLALQGELKQ
jgi:Protein of unknown function (DUF4058)